MSYMLPTGAFLQSANLPAAQFPPVNWVGLFAEMTIETALYVEFNIHHVKHPDYIHTHSLSIYQLCMCCYFQGWFLLIQSCFNGPRCLQTQRAGIAWEGSAPTWSHSNIKVICVTANGPLYGKADNQPQFSHIPALFFNIYFSNLYPAIPPSGVLRRLTNH